MFSPMFGGSILREIKNAHKALATRGPVDVSVEIDFAVQKKSLQLRLELKTSLSWGARHRALAAIVIYAGSSVNCNSLDGFIDGTAADRIVVPEVRVESV